MSKQAKSSTSNRERHRRLALLLLGSPLWAGCNVRPADMVASDGDDEAVDPNSGTSVAEGSSTGAFDIHCYPGRVRCSGTQALEVCAPTGLEWVEQPCGSQQMCVPCDGDDESCIDHCSGPCEVTADLPSSAGCSFVASRQLHPYEDWEDGLVFGNPSTENTAIVNIFYTPEGERTEEHFAGPFSLPPGMSDYVLMGSAFATGEYSRLRSGGIYRVSSDLPVIAYQHSPLFNNRGNDSSMLLPETALGQNYVVTAYSGAPQAVNNGDGLPSYFVVVAVEDNTKVSWTPPVPTQGDGLPIPAVAAGETGQITLNRFDTLRVVPSSVDVEPLQRDVSGTIVAATKPVWVMGAVRCAPVPAPADYLNGTCDPLQEVMLPLEHWGRRYVAASAPTRDTEQTTWRVYAGSDGVTVESDPPIAELPHTFAKRGDYLEFRVPGGTHLMLEGDGTFMPVQYLHSRLTETEAGQDVESFGAPGRGDPSMVQMVPTEQFLDRYTFVTGLGFETDYATIIRRAGGADVFIDDTIVEGYAAVGDFEVAHVVVAEGAHVADSSDPFGLVQVGYSSAEWDEDCVNNADPDGTQINCNSSYAYPGGMKTEAINIP